MGNLSLPARYCSVGPPGRGGWPTDQPDSQERSLGKNAHGRPAGLLLLLLQHVLHNPRYAGAGAAVVAAAGLARHHRLARPSLLLVTHHTAFLVSLDAKAAQAAGVAACGVL